ncbi:MAG: hypothetical protein H0U53_10010 [Actinobacteria bacterium]|nr:hypothetical protein [Actinomycetota bacterium]
MRRITVFCLFALVAATLSPATKAVAAHGGGLTVQVGSQLAVGDNCDPDTGKRCRSGESMRFLAPALSVHKGDTVNFDFASFHTATLLPVGQDALVFRGSQTGGVGKPYSLLIQDPDDTAEEGAPAEKPAVKANPATANRTIGGAPADCGTPDNPCDYDGTQVVNSGLPLGPGQDTFAATVTANAGQGFWVICLVHTHMFLRVNVVADSATTTTQELINTTKASMIASDLEWAQETDAKLLRARSSHVTSSGQRVYDVKAGVDNHWAALLEFYPKKVSVPKGATVRYHFGNLVYEDHTVTLPAPSAFDLFPEFFAFGCDPDADAGPGPDTPPGEGPPCGGNFSQIEIDISSRAMWGMGDGIFTGSTDLEHSGVRGAQFSNSFYDVKFRARSAKKGWKAFCLIHGPGMANRVVVKPTI